MLTINLSKSALEQLLAARRQIRLEFDAVIHLSDDNLAQQIAHYRHLSNRPDTQALLDLCLVSLGAIPQPAKDPEPAQQKANLSSLLERAEAAKKQKDETKWSQMGGGAVSYFD